MKTLFVILAVIMLLYVIFRKIDMFSIAIVCLLIYNYYCSKGYVFIASHEQVNVNYYGDFIDRRVYVIILTQMVLLLLATIYYDYYRKPVPAVHSRKYSVRETDRNFFIMGILGILILITNVAGIGLSHLSDDKALVWKKTTLLYTTGQWLAMAVFTYAVKNKKYKYLILAVPPVLVHLFIGSRTHFAVLCIVFLLYYGQTLRDSFFTNFKTYALGFTALFFIMVYKKIYELVKILDFDSIIQALSDPNTYTWVFAWGEPRIVLADFNYLVTSGVRLDRAAILNRLAVFVPFMDDLIGGGNRLMSAIIYNNLNSSYGLASNIWGEFYIIASYPLILVMYLIWLRLLFWANDILMRDSWTSYFLIPLLSYYAFYIHRMDFIKVIGNAKMVLFAMVLWWMTAAFFRREYTLTIPRQKTG